MGESFEDWEARAASPRRHHPAVRAVAMVAVAALVLPIVWSVLTWLV